MKASESSSTRRPILDALKEHVVQIEALVLYSILYVVVLYYLSLTSFVTAKWLLPCILLLPLPGVVRVTNPSSTARDRLNWAATIGGALGVVGGALVDVASMGLTLGQGTLIGFGVGAGVGAAVGPKLEALRNRRDLLERGEAFEFLHQHRKEYTHIANARLIEEALSHRLSSFDINQDGKSWYSIDDLRRFLKDPDAFPDRSKSVP